MNTNNLVINRALSAWMKNKTTGDLIFNLIDVKEPSLEIAGEQVYATDSIGQKIAAFDRNKEAKISCQSSLFDLNLIAAQVGTEKVEAGKSAKILAPVVDILEAQSKKITLSKTPKEGYSITQICKLNNDGSIASKYGVNPTATATQFSITGNQISLPTAEDIKDGDRFYVNYMADYDKGVSVVSSADGKADSGEFVLEVLFCDPCDQATEYHGYVIFPNGKLTNEATIEMNVEAAQQFTIEALQDWCSKDKKLFEIVVVGE